jgi:hypothetical protein
MWGTLREDRLTVYIVDSSMKVRWSCGLYRGRGGPDHPGIRTTEDKLRGVGIVQKKSSFRAKVKLLKAEILYLRAYNNNNNNNIR